MIIWFTNFHTHIQYITRHLNGSAFVTVFESHQKPLNLLQKIETQNYTPHYLLNNSFITISVVNV
jgi:hypothetical protein